MKVYRGNNEGGSPASQHLITVCDGDDVAMLCHRVRHSPTGLSWGYGGSGPADLARSILWDYLGAEPHPACYQPFKFDFVARWPQDGSWTLTADEVAEWMKRWHLDHPDTSPTVQEWEREYE